MPSETEQTPTWSPTKQVIRFTFLPVMYGLGVVSAVLVAHGSATFVVLAVAVVVAIALATIAERVVPYADEWNDDVGDTGRDIKHAVVNEVLMLASAAALPIMTAFLGDHHPWPGGLPFAIQILIAVLVLDLGITLVHMLSHRLEWLWRFHAVHHSVERLYGFNGLMKHPVHQLVETAGGALPLVLLGVPPDVAAVAALFVAIQLLLQHSNAWYVTGPLRYVLSLNEGHRFHHLRWPGVGDVNFGLFTLVWDHLFGTFSYDPGRQFSSADIGIAKWPNYPREYVSQLQQPFLGETGHARLGANSSIDPGHSV